MMKGGSDAYRVSKNGNFSTVGMEKALDESATLRSLKNAMRSTVKGMRGGCLLK